MFGFRGIHHLAISVPSVAAAREFYVDKLGFELADLTHIEPSELGDKVTNLEGADMRVLMVKAGNVFLEIFEFLSPEPATQIDRPICDHGYTHLAFEVEDVQAAYVFLAEAGVNWHHEPIEAGDGYLMTYGRDPFGNVIEIQQLIAGLPYSFEALALPS